MKPLLVGCNEASGLLGYEKAQYCRWLPTFWWNICLYLPGWISRNIMCEDHNPSFSMPWILQVSNLYCDVRKRYMVVTITLVLLDILSKTWWQIKQPLGEIFNLNRHSFQYGDAPSQLVHRFLILLFRVAKPTATWISTYTFIEC
jgi:hypothetical protein